MTISTTSIETPPGFHYLDFSDGSFAIYLRGAQSFIFPENKYRHALKYACVANPDPETLRYISHISDLQIDYVNEAIAQLKSIQENLFETNSHIYINASTADQLEFSGYSAISTCYMQSISLGFEDYDAIERYQQITAYSLTNIQSGSKQLCDIHVTGQSDRYTVTTRDGFTFNCANLDEAVVCAHCNIDDLVAKIINPLFIAHAGAVSAASNGILIPGLGSSGKSTLVNALCCGGYELINDDIVPITINGYLAPLGGSIKLRSGTWNRFDNVTKHVGTLDTIHTQHDSVKLFMARKSHTTLPTECTIIICPHYTEGSEPSSINMSSSDVLRILVDCGSIFPRPMNPTALHILTAWIDNLSGFRISYGNTEASLQLVNRIVNDEWG